MNNANVLMLLILFMLICEFGYRRLAIDYFRERLFGIRNELFDIVMNDSNLKFEMKAYRDMEQLINGTIRFANRIRFFDLIIVSLFIGNKYPEYSKESKNNFGKEFSKALREIEDESTKKKLENARFKYQIALIRYLYSRSLILIIISMPLFIYFIAKEIVNSIKENALKKNEIKNEVSHGILRTFSFQIFKIENEACVISC